MMRPGWIRVANDLGGSEQAVELAEEHYLAALGLFVLALGYCDRQGTDGEIPARAMARAIASGVKSDEVVAELERTGFLETTPDGWRIPGYLDWQRSREQIEAAVEQRRQAGRASAAARLNAGQEKIDRETEKTEEIDTPVQRAAERTVERVVERGDTPPPDLLQAIERAMVRKLGADDHDTVAAWSERFGPDAVRWALDVAVARGCRELGYVGGILSRATHEELAVARNGRKREPSEPEVLECPDCRELGAMAKQDCPICHGTRFVKNPAAVRGLEAAEETS